MASLPALIRSGLVAGVLAALATGCVTTFPMLGGTKCEQACQIVCVWQNSVAFAPDPTRGGQPGAGFVGRVYLFGQTMGFPLLEEGSLMADLIDESSQPPTLLERWNIDPVTLARLTKKDFMGDGYTLFLPSQHYRASMTKIRLKVAFTPKGRTPIYTENSITLAESNGVIRESTTPVIPRTPMPVTR